MLNYDEPEDFTEIEAGEINIDLDLIRICQEFDEAVAKYGIGAIMCELNVDTISEIVDAVDATR